MGEWKALKREAGSGWKELIREAGTGGWKELEWESAYEDFTTFTEVDIGADRIQKTANHIDHLAYANENTYLYKDYGIGHFGDFTHKFQFKVDASTKHHSNVYLLANEINISISLILGNKTHIKVFSYENKIYLRERYGGTSYTDYYTGVSIDTWYYIRVVKSGTSLNVYIYSDSGFSNLIDTLSLTLQANHTFRYLYPANTHNSSADYSANLDIDKYDIGE